MIARCSIPRRMRDGPDDRTDNRKHHRDASAPPARSFPGKSRESGISGGGDTRTATAERAKGEPSEGSPFCFGAENGTRTRAARERFRELWQIPPTPGRGALRSQVPSPSCTGIQKKEGRTFWILPSCFGAENGFPTQAYSSFIISVLCEAFFSKVTSRCGHHALVCIPMLSTKIMENSI